jgi:L-rhamnose mutarotase
MKTWCLALDLQDDPELIEKYKWYHQREHIWPEVIDNIRRQGILSERIYSVGNRLFMVLETTDDFSFEAKAARDAADPKMQEWEELMWTFQKPLPQAKAGEKWILMEKIFDLEP